MTCFFSKTNYENAFAEKQTTNLPASHNSQATPLNPELQTHFPVPLIPSSHRPFPLHTLLGYPAAKKGFKIIFFIPETIVRKQSNFVGGLEGF